MSQKKLFDAYYTAHEAIGHKSRDLMVEELKKKQANYAMWALKSKIYANRCKFTNTTV